MRIPILTYHSLQLDGNDYASNDHVALARDLEIIDALGFEIRPLHELVLWRKREPARLEHGKYVALTCDDGSDFDFRDIEHPSLGVQRGFLNVLKDFRRARPSAQPGLFMTSFVIVSDAARRVLDHTCLVDNGWWNSSWWPLAVESGLMGIASHSWDHNHISLPASWHPGVQRGVFTSIDTEELADMQVRKAAQLIWNFAPNPAARVFAYPYGEDNDFLVGEYLPRHAEELRLDAAVGASPEPWTEHSNLWRLPRYVHAGDWRDEKDLERILNDARYRLRK